MKIVAVVEVKARLSALLADVENGEEIAITRHGRVVARLVPETPAMAADVFRPFWSDSEIDFEAPADAPPSAVQDFD